MCHLDQDGYEISVCMFVCLSACWSDINALQEIQIFYRIFSLHLFVLVVRSEDMCYFERVFHIIVKVITHSDAHYEKTCISSLLKPTTGWFLRSCKCMQPRLSWNVAYNHFCTKRQQTSVLFVLLLLFFYTRPYLYLQSQKSNHSLQ